ncbi:MAG TPA: hypothetical protein VGU20_11560 [Stellaceae bacterium]|nr:hypothetical protein [Stellaceae bacterium]
MRTLWTTALLALILIGAASAQAPEPAQSGTEPAAEAAAPPASAAPPAASSTLAVRAVIAAPQRTADGDWLAEEVQWMGAVWEQLAPARSFLAAITWNPVLLTFFNGLLALFAYRLWRTGKGVAEAVHAQSAEMARSIAVLKDAAEATRQIAEAALLQARASVGVELPRLELSDIRLLHSDESIRQALKSPAAALAFTNHGRTTAFLTTRCIELRLADALPEEPEYRAIEPLEIAEAVVSGGSVAADAEQRLGELGEDEVEALRLGRRTLWVYGFVAFRDFLGIEHRKGFSLRWRPPQAQAAIGGSFQPDGPDAYVYEREEAGNGSRPAATIPFVLTERAPPLRKPAERMIEPVAVTPRPRAVARG